MSKRLTLAEQLAQISEPAPQDFDPEDSYATYNAERGDASTSQDQLAAGRADYVDVGPSGLRKKGAAVVDVKYAGKKGSRRALYDDEDSDGEDDDEDEEQDDEGSMSDEDGSDMGDFEDLEAAEEGDSADEDESDEAATPPPPPPTAASKKSKTATAASTGKKPSAKQLDDKAMLVQLKQAASADVEKGRDVKKQLAFCDNVLESRIKIQKAATAVNLLPQPSNADKYFSAVAVATEVDSTMAEVRALNEELFALRSTLLKLNEQVELPSDFGTSRKRKRGLGAEKEYVAATVRDLKTMEDTVNPFLRATVTKWSDKVLAASGLAVGAAGKKFKAVNQNAMAQVDHILSASGERERLVKRTRVRRGDNAASGAVSIVGKQDDTALEGEKKATDDEVFDDGDFYQLLLKEVIESRMLDLDDPTLASLRLATARGKKNKKVVDTRASKGRKIRYHVHEKIQNFMIPIDAGGWHEEQVDELFASLLGRTQGQPSGGAASVDEDKRSTEPARGEVDVGSLRIFG